jgi:hypothetical protein
MTMINFKQTDRATGKETALDFDLSSLPGPMAERLQSLLTSSNFFEVPLVQYLRAGPEESEYTMTVVAGNSLHTVHVTDSSMPKSLRPLVDALREIAEATT